MEDIVNMFVNNSTAIACLIYFMWFNNTTLKEFTSQMQEMNESIIKLLEKTTE